jgi:hypothetical protein
MAWRTGLLNINNRPVFTIIDDQFQSAAPAEHLPHLAWFGVYCALPCGKQFWNPDEKPQLDAIERDLLRLCDVHGNGWAAYVQQLTTHGMVEYYVYFGDGAAMERVLPELQTIYPNYRIEYDRTEDPKWAQYAKWLGWLATRQIPIPGQPAR